MLKVRETKFPQTIFLELTGQFDHYSIAEIESRILRTHELSCKQIILDFSGITGIDSIVLGHLFLWYHKMQPHHVKLRIVNPLSRIREVLEQSHISDLIPISFSDLETIAQEIPSHTIIHSDRGSQYCELRKNEKKPF
jgi:anti-anti-sigma factor